MNNRDKITGIAVCLVLIIAYQAGAQVNGGTFSVSGDLTTIYTLGNAAEDQKIPDATAVGAYFDSPTAPAKKNGFFTAANLHVSLNPFPWLEGYFKLYAIDRPGSMYLPLQLENNGKKSLTEDMTLDSVYGRVSVFQALDLEMPIDLFLKAGRYKAQASHFGTVSKYYTEQLLYWQNTKTDLTYELGIGLNDPNITISAATNYMLTEATQSLYDDDGMLPHGNQVLNEYAPQFLFMAKLANMEIAGRDKLSAEVLYGNNVAGIYSGHSAGLSARYSLENLAGGTISVPIGLSFIFYEKNIDLLARAAVNPPGSPTATIDLRNSIGVGLGAGLRYSNGDGIDLDVNIAGTFNVIEHYYREPLSIARLSFDTMFTAQERFFIGGGFFAGTLADARWKTKDDITTEDFDHTFTLAENMAFEVYGGINFGGSGKFVIGFNQNKGLSLNHMLEAKPEGQMKYKQADTEWTFSDRLVEAGGLYFKFLFRW